jgi:hydrogenase nickel incorporation protein HypB
MEQNQHEHDHHHHHHDDEHGHHHHHYSHEGHGDSHTHNQHHASAVNIHYHFHGEIGHYHVHNHYLSNSGKIESEGVIEHEHHDHEPSIRTIDIGKKVLEKNDIIASQNRTKLAESGIKALNIISSPGSGKTKLLEKTLERLANEMKIAVLVGDQQTDNDAARLTDKGAWVKQINTHSSCHLDAEMVSKEIDEIIEFGTELLLIENVGNLVCPAAFDLGEVKKVALLSSPEGEDKPVKYPVLFHDADVVVLTKMDLIAHLDWSLDKCEENIKAVKHDAEIITLSSITEEGFDNWINYLKNFLNK